MKIGIVGLPNVGKSTLFNAITDAGAQSENYPFCTIEPNIGVVAVPDDRLDALQKIHNSEKVIPASIEFLDIAGLVRGASRGEGLGNKFLSHIREAAAILHVVRCFDDPNIIHVDGEADPRRDAETINLELIFSDIEMIERRIEKTKKLIKADKKHQVELDLMEKILAGLQEGQPACALEYSPTEIEILETVELLTKKPVMYGANLSEKDFLQGVEKCSHYQELQKVAKREKAAIIPFCAKIEADIASLGPEEKLLFLKDIGLEKSSLDRLIEAGYELLGLISFLTAGPKEVRAWTIRSGLRAPQAAGVIHSDFERGFIRAETISYTDLMKVGTLAAAREKGLIRSEGKDYIVKDGDVMLFRFNV
jgi:GTP-binding protein YchF